MLDKKSQDLISYLDGTLRNCEQVLFSNFDEPAVSRINLELRLDLSARQIAKLYGFTQKLLTKHIDQLGVGCEDTGFQDEVCILDHCHACDKMKCCSLVGHVHYNLPSSVSYVG